MEEFLEMISGDFLNFFREPRKSRCFLTSKTFKKLSIIFVYQPTRGKVIKIRAKLIMDLVLTVEFNLNVTYILRSIF